MENAVAEKQEQHVITLSNGASIEFDMDRDRGKEFMESLALPMHSFELLKQLPKRV